MDCRSKPASTSASTAASACSASAMVPTTRLVGYGMKPRSVCLVSMSQFHTGAGLPPSIQEDHIVLLHPLYRNALGDRTSSSCFGSPAWPPCDENFIVAPSCRETAGRIGSDSAVALVDKVLVRPCLSTSDHGNHENGHRRLPQDAPQRRTEHHAVEP